MKRVLEILEYRFRHAIVYPLLRFVFRNKQYPAPIDLGAVKSLLILRYDKIGDMIVTIPILRALKRQYPNLHLGILASPINNELLDGETSVDERFVLHANPFQLFNEVKRMRAASFDVVVNFIFNRTTTGGLLANVVAPNGIKAGQGDAKYSFYFNKMAKLERNAMSMTNLLISFLDQIFSRPFPREYLSKKIFVSDAARSAVAGFLKENRLEAGQFALINISVGETVRQLNAEQWGFVRDRLWKHSGLRSVVLAMPTERETAALLTSSRSYCTLFPGSGRATLQQIAGLVEQARLVVSPDTSIVHFAAAMGTPVLGLYADRKLDEEWKPEGVPSVIVCSEKDRPASAISHEQIAAGLDELFRSIM